MPWQLSAAQRGLLARQLIFFSLKDRMDSPPGKSGKTGLSGAMMRIAFLHVLVEMCWWIGGSGTQ